MEETVASEETLVVAEKSAPSTAPGTGNLQRTLTKWNAVALVIGTIIGSGIFASPGVVVRHAGSPGMATLIWTICGALAYCGALSYCELGAALPSAGGEITFLNRIYGSLTSFLFIWTNALITRPAALGIISLVFGEYACRAFLSRESADDAASCSSRSPQAKGLAVLCLVVVTVLHVVSLKAATKVLSVLTFSKITSLLFVALGGFVFWLVTLDSESEESHVKSLADAFRGTSSDPLDYPLAFLAALWAFDGWNNLIYAAEEMHSMSDFVNVLRWCVPFITFLYVVVNLAYLAVLPLSTVRESTTLGVDLAQSILGAKAGRIVMPLCVAASALGAAVGTLYSGSRLVYASGRGDAYSENQNLDESDSTSGALDSSDDAPTPRDTTPSLPILPGCFGFVSPRTATPVRAILAQSAIALGMFLAGDFEQLLSIFGSATWIFYALTVAGVLRLRWREPNLPRPYVVNLAAPVAFTLAALFLVGIETFANPINSFLAFGFILSGVPFWYFRVRRGAVFPCDRRDGRCGWPNNRHQVVHPAPLDVELPAVARPAAGSDKPAEQDQLMMESV